MEQTLTPKDLAARWHVTLAILKKRRREGRPPRFTRIGNNVKVVYTLQDILKYEADNLNFREQILNEDKENTTPQYNLNASDWLGDFLSK